MPAVDNWIKFSGGRIYYQHVGHIYYPYVDDRGYNPPIRVEVGDIKRLEYTIDENERTITLTAADTRIFSHISIIYYEGSDKAYGYLTAPALNVWGWLEPLDDAIVVKGYQSIIYGD